MDAALGVDVAGLTSDQAAARLAVDGPNVFPSARVVPVWRRFAAQLVHFFALMLWVAGALALVVGMPQMGIAIFVVILINGTFAFAQEFRAERAAFATVILSQIGVAFACRSATRWPGRLGWFSNRLLLVGVATALGLLACFLFIPPVASVLGQAPPPPLGWLMAMAAVPVMLGVDALHKSLRRRRGRRAAAADVRRGFTVMTPDRSRPR